MKTIPLTQGRVALVDDQDFDRLRVFRWNVRKCGPRHFYAVRYDYRTNEDGERERFAIYMHRDVCAGLCSDRPHVDHIDGDGLNNQRHNLRACTPHDNHGNQKKANASKTTSKYKGVSWDASRELWKAYVKVYGSTIHIGRFKQECNAATAFNFIAADQFGEFAVYNLPEAIA